MLKRAGRGEEALVHMREAVKDHPEARYALGFELVEQGKHAEAVVELTRFLADYPTSPEAEMAHTLTATALVAQQNYREAVGHYQALAERQPQNAQAWITLGAVLAQTDDFERSEQALRRGLQLAPRDSDGHMLLGLVLESKGDTAGALNELRTAVSLDPSNSDARQHLNRLGG
jgi:Flp pilus assembly protein TadD